MTTQAGFRLPRLCLPRAGIDMSKWAVVACDQYTAEPEYWHEVADTVGDAPSTLQLIFPEAYLGQADAPARITRIQLTMDAYLGQGMLRDHLGAVLVERSVGGRTRRGLMLELDLEQYDFSAASTSLIRPTEGTLVERIAPRLAVRRGAALELPHVLVLIDDPARTVLEPLAAAVAAAAAPPLYDIALMQHGGRVAGHAVDDAAADAALAALAALGEAATFSARYGMPAGTPPMLFAVGDGNHSLATAKSAWDSIKSEVGMDHPARWALVEVVNIHDPALAFEPIHRLLFGVNVDLAASLSAIWGQRLTCTDVASAAAMREQVRAAAPGQQTLGLIGPGARFRVLALAEAPSALAVGTVQPVLDRLLADGALREIDYVHGDEVIERLAQHPGNLGIHLPPVDKRGLLRMVVREGPLPRKAFSMGQAHEKRFYVEARRIR